MEYKYDNILIPIDFSHKTDLLVEQGYHLARLMNSSMTLLHVVNKGSGITYKDQQSFVSYSGSDEDAYTKIRRLANHFSKIYDHEVNYEVLAGNVFDQIVNYAKETSARLIVMGKSGKTSLLTNSIGKYAAQVVRNADCPVFTINSIIKSSFDKILLPLDLSKQIKDIISIAISFSRYYGSTMKLLTVINDTNFTEEKIFIEKMNRTRDFLFENNVACGTETIYNFTGNLSVADRIIQYSIDTESDVIMLMTRQEKDWRDTFIGSTATNVIKNSLVPVISISPNNNTKKII